MKNVILGNIVLLALYSTCVIHVSNNLLQLADNEMS